MASTTEEQAQHAQSALRTTSKAYRASLIAEIHQLRHEPGTGKVLDLAKELRAQALFVLSEGTKEKFEANQATWRAWDQLVQIIEVGPKQVDIPKEQ
jgi:hypothetical protein